MTVQNLILNLQASKFWYSLQTLKNTMIHPQKITEIQMPLTIGQFELLDAKHQQKSTLCSLDYNLLLNLRNDIHFRKFLLSKSTSQKFTCNYSITCNKQVEVVSENENEDLLELCVPSLNRLKTFKLFKESNPKSMIDQQFTCSFRVEMCPLRQKHPNILELKIIQENVAFQLLKLNSNSVKFVRNKLLTQLLHTEQNEQRKGLLTMDQSGRFLIQSIGMPFPVIGFWVKSQLGLQNMEILNHLLEFTKQKYSKKCIFKFKTAQFEKKYFYFVRLTEQNKMETYLVSWNVGEPLTKSFAIKYESESSKIIKISSKSCQNVLKESLKSHQVNLKQKSLQGSSQNSSQSRSSLESQQNGMDFTLRKYKHNDQFSTLESLINYSYLSPIKQLEDNEKQEDPFSNMHQNSPQFSTLMKESKSENECVELRTKVKQQENEIHKLKQIIAEMQSELKLYKNSRMSTHYQSHQKRATFASGLSSPQINQFSLGSNQNSHNSSPKEVRRLRQSDLRSNSVSRSGDWIKNSSNKKVFENKSQSTSGGKQSDSGKQQAFILQKECISEEKKYKPLPQITEEDPRDPWQYMELIDC